LSLFGALSLGSSSLAAQQAALQVTGNNIANAGTQGYTREVTNLAPMGSDEVAPGQTTGDGVTVSSIQRQVDEALNENLRDATSDQNSAQTLDSTLTQLQSTFGALNTGDLSSQLSSFFGGFSTLATNPTDSSMQAQVIQNGTSIAEYLQNLRSQVSSIQTNTNSQIGTLTQQANTLLQGIASLNQQIAGSGANGANSLMDERDQDLTQLSQLMNITTVDQGNGMVNVLAGNTTLVNGTTTRGLSTAQVTDPTGTFTNTQVVYGDTGDQANVTGGQIGGLITARDGYVTPAISTIDTIAGGLINAVNTVYSQGQGATGFGPSLTGTTTVMDPNAALNATTAQTGIAFPPTNGTFNLYITDTTSTPPVVTTQQINVNLTGQGTQTSLNSLAASITAAGGGVIKADGSTGQLVITSNNPDVTFGFGQDTSGALAALGVNTFFTGSNASNIAVNNVIQNNPALLATGRYNQSTGTTDSQANATALSTAGSAALSMLGGQSLTDYYTNYIGSLATQAQNVGNNVTATGTIQSTLLAQQQSVSGVSMDEETVNMMQYQRAFEGSARFITVVDEMMQDVLGLIQ